MNSLSRGALGFTVGFVATSVLVRVAVGRDPLLLAAVGFTYAVGLLLLIDAIWRRR